MPIAAAAMLVAGCANHLPFGGRVVQIDRTTYGIAHVTASDYEGIGYGVAYAYAQDNLCLTAEHLLTLRGDRSRFLGAQGASEIGTPRLSNLQSDLFIRAHMDDAALEHAASTSSPDVQASMRGYVAGYNRYLRDAIGAGTVPESCRGKPWLQPMTMTDVRRSTEQGMILGGLAAFAGAVLGVEPPSAAARTDEADVAPQIAAAELAHYSFDSNPDGGEYGSNGWAFGRNATPDGRGVLLGNPHFPWNGPSRFWQVHLTIPGLLDVMGETGNMSPLVTIGFNHDVAWTHTVSTGKRFTLYELKLDPADPTVYLVDGERRKMTTKTVALPSEAAPGAAAISKVFYRSEWGPIIVISRAGLGWTRAHAFAFRDANSLNTRAGDAWLRMARAHDVRELRAAMGNQGIPWLNTIAADRNGDAMYADLSVVPDVSADILKSCSPSPAAAALFRTAGLVVLDGSRSACAWARDPAAAAPGIIAPNRMPVLITADWVQNSNDSYWLSNPDVAPMAGVSPLVGALGTMQRLRTRSGIMEIRARLSGRDGLAGNRMGVDELRSVIFRDRNLAGQLVMDDLGAACKATAAALSPDASEGCRVLVAWDRTSNADSAGAPLFREFWRKAKDIPKVWRVPFDPGQPIATPSGLDMDTPVTRNAVFKALAEAVGTIRAAGFAADVALGVPQSRVVQGQRVALHGGDEFEGVLNMLQTQGQPTINAGGYRVNYGSSYLQVVTFDDRGPVAQGILTYGQSSEPGSEHAYDQLPMFAAKQWQPLPFHPEDVESQRVGRPLLLNY
ncbi:MAG TPA: penicillin acylase family protein [Caldimonas sp.]